MSNEKKNKKLDNFKNQCKKLALDYLQSEAVCSSYQEMIHGIREKWLLEGLKAGLLLGSLVLFPKYRLLTGVSFVYSIASSLVNINNLKIMEKARVDMLQSMLKVPQGGGVPPIPNKGNLN